VQSHTLLAETAGIELRAEIANDVPEIWADRHRLLQVLDNLIGNAIKFTPRGGHITLGATPSNGKVLLRVSDTGAGIAADHLAHIFDRYWQARARDRRGTGLGLAIVKGIVDAHGGKIWVESAPGRGTTIFFTLAAAPLREETRRTG
jgi:signal transduction histidine kinase